jgi:hypothetical protein
MYVSWRICSAGCLLTVARNNEKFVIVGQFMYLDVGESSDDLRLGGQLCALLELEVSNGARKRQVSVDPAEVDKAASGSDSRFFSCRWPDGRDVS